MYIALPPSLFLSQLTLLNTHHPVQQKKNILYKNFNTHNESERVSSQSSNSTFSFPADPNSSFDPSETSCASVHISWTPARWGKRMRILGFSETSCSIYASANVVERFVKRFFEPKKNISINNQKLFILII